MKLEIFSVIDNLMSVLKQGDVLLLYGPMGAGKTFFTQKLCAELGIKKVQSPTFTLVNEYISEDGKYENGKWKILHTDLYRLPFADETIFEEIYSPNHICVIEWAEKLSDEMIDLMALNSVYKLQFSEPGEMIDFSKIK